MSPFPGAMDLSPLLALNWGSLFWNFAAFALFVLGLILVLVILIQDSQGGGLGGSFGGGGGDVLGARAQRGITKFTAVLGIIFGVTTLLLGKFNPDQELTLTGEDGTSLQEGAEAEDGIGMGTDEPGDTLLDETEPETPATPEGDAPPEDSAEDGERTIQDILSGDESEGGGEASEESPPDENDTSN